MPKSFISILVAAVFAYLGVMGFMYARQRDFMYFPQTTEVSPESRGFGQAKTMDLRTRDGERIVAWWVPPASDEKPVYIYLHGNAGNLSTRTERFQKIVNDGSGLLAIDWRGYGGSTGKPTEEGLQQDAMAAYQWLAEQISPQRIVVFGESLGSGLAVWLASKLPVGVVVLDSPFLSALAMAEKRYWYLPVSWLMKDTYRSDLSIRNMTAPTLVMHGDADGVIPFTQGEILFALAPAPKQFYRIAGGGHVVAYSHDGETIVRDFVRRYVK